MVTAKKCADKTLQLVKKPCVQKTNKLAYENYPKAKRGEFVASYVPAISVCPATRIRVCTPAEVKRMAGPRLCECPRMTEDFKMIQFIMKVIRNTAKGLILLAVVYITIDLGFWGIPEMTEETFAGLCNVIPCSVDPCADYKFKASTQECVETLELLSVSPYNPCSCIDPIPIDHERAVYKMKTAWNHGIIFVFESVRYFPDNVINYLHKKYIELITAQKGRCKKSGSIKEEEEKPCELLDYEDDDEEEEEEDECAEYRT